MADDYGDKTEAPTPRRRAEAREQGNVARSQDLTPAAILLGVMFTLHATGPKLVAALKTLIVEMLGADSLANFTTSSAASGTLRAVYLVGGAIAPLLCGVVAIALLANVLQVGFHLNPERLQPNLGALNPIRGFGKIFNFKGPTQLALNLVKVTLLGLVAYSAVSERRDEIKSVQQLGFVQIFGIGSQLVYSVAMRLGVAMLFLAVLDYAYQRWLQERELRMTKQEIKEEMRRMDGDPKIKQRRRQIAMQMLKERLKKDVPTADVVVTNPTEFAIALKYDPQAMHAPRVIAKGQGLVAKRIREIAIEAGIPILERKPLARALYKLVEVGQEIPEQFFSAVAEILAYVYELSGKSQRSVGSLAGAA